jgi:hypothetical protein
MSQWKLDKPEHEHDCERCKFLGNYMPSPQKISDLYYCPGADGGAIVCRNSDDGPDYWSMPVCMLINPVYKHGNQMASIALKRAVSAGYLKSSDMWSAAQYF